MAETPDISKIIGVIMQNPALISQIASLVGSSDKEAEKDESQSPVADAPLEEDTPVAISAPREVQDHSRARRKELLNAMKPYLSEQRRGAIDSMASILDIIDVMSKKES